MRTIFGRDPALIAGLIEAVVLLATTFGLDWTTEQIVGVNTAVAAVLTLYVGWASKETQAGVVLQAGKALLIAAAGFGANLGPDRTAAVLGFITVAFAYWQRDQITAIVAAPGSPGVVAGSDPVTVVGEARGVIKG